MTWRYAPRWLSIISYPTRARGIIVKYISYRTRSSGIIVKSINTKIIVWSEDEERSISLQVERKQSKHKRQRSAVATQSFTPVGQPGNRRETLSSNS